MQTVALISSILSPFLVFGASYLSIRQASKKLRQDVTLHLYQKQLEACSTLFYFAETLAGEILAGYPLKSHEHKMRKFRSDTMKLQFYLPARVLRQLLLFRLVCEN